MQQQRPKFLPKRLKGFIYCVNIHLSVKMSLIMRRRINRKKVQKRERLKLLYLVQKQVTLKEQFMVLNALLLLILNLKSLKKRVKIRMQVLLNHKLLQAQLSMISRKHSSLSYSQNRSEKQVSQPNSSPASTLQIYRKAFQTYLHFS